MIVRPDMVKYHVVNADGVGVTTPTIHRTEAERLAVAGAKFGTVRSARQVASGELYEAIQEAVAAGMSEYTAARVAGVDRMTVRNALGKRRPR